MDLEKQALTKRQIQAMETKKRIQTKAVELILERGFEHITIADICGAAGVSNGNFYHYFSSKEDVLRFAYSNFDEYVEKEFSKRSFSSSLEAVRTLIYEQVVGANKIGPKIESQIFQAQLRMHGGYVTDEARFFPAYLKRLLQQAVEDGEIHPSYSAEEVASIVLQISRGILLDWALREGGFSVEGQAMKALSMLFKALQQPNPGVVYGQDACEEH